MVFLPFILTVAVTTPDLVHVVFGSKWDAAIPVMRILAIACAMLSIQGVCDSVLQGSGAVRVYLRMSAFSFALNLVAFIVGIQWGLVGMAVAFGISTFTFIVIDIGVVARAIHAPVRLFAKAIVGVLVAALALVVVEVSVFALLTQTDVGPVVRTAVTAIAGLAVFAGLCRWREREAWVELMRFAGETLRGARRGVNDAGVTEAHGPAEAAATPSATTLQSVITGSKYRPFEPGTSKRDVLAGVLAMHAQFSRESSGGPQPRRQLIGRDGGFVEIHSSEAIGTRPANSDSVPIPPS